jgi:hypothetical protein
MEMKQINFYRPNEEHGYLSNFSNHSVEINGKMWKTTEHYYQAMKAEGTPHEDVIRECPTPRMAKKLGREAQLRTDWESVKDGIMLVAVDAKFHQHKELADALLGTGKETLVEHTCYDSYWGDGGDGSGLNMLGKILMDVRGAIRRERLDKLVKAARLTIKNFTFDEERLDFICRIMEGYCKHCGAKLTEDKLGGSRCYCMMEE